MRRVILLASLLSSGLLYSGAAHATDVGSSRNFGLGFQIGDPTGLTGKVFMGGDNAFDFGLGFWGYGYGWCYDRNGRRYDCGGGYRRWSIHGDFLWQQNIVRSTAKLDWHIGVGGRLYIHDNAYGDDVWFAARMPIGLDLAFARPDFLELFLEAAPSLFVVPFFDFDIDVAIGVRFYF